MLAKDVIHSLLDGNQYIPKKSIGEAYAPSNIALVKYWGKRHQELFLPNNSSVSISLGDKGARTSVRVLDGAHEHQVYLNDKMVNTDSEFYQKIKAYLDFFAQQLPYKFLIKTYSSVPIAAGVASSACGFAALVLALNDLFDFKVDKEKLSILARLGSGSASRSLWDGFVVWHCGEKPNGMDAFAEPLDIVWPELMVGLWCFDHSEKPVSSRKAMQNTVETSELYKVWPGLAETACANMCDYIKQKDFIKIGQLAESNALFMHATMQNATPAVNYWLPESVHAMQQVWQARRDGLDVYFTMDAGPNLKLLVLEKDQKKLKEIFPQVEWICPFNKNK